MQRHKSTLKFSLSHPPRCSVTRSHPSLSFSMFPFILVFFTVNNILIYYTSYLFTKQQHDICTYHLYFTKHQTPKNPPKQTNNRSHLKRLTHIFSTNSIHSSTWSPKVPSPAIPLPPFCSSGLETPPL